MCSDSPEQLRVCINIQDCALPSTFQENIISPMEDSPIPDISGKDASDGAGTSPRSQGKAFRYWF